MKDKRLIGYTLVALFSVVTGTLSRGADETDARDAKAKRQELREKMKGMSPEERRAALKKWRAEHPEAGRAAVEELRKQREALKNLTPEEREARRKELRAQVEKRIAELEQRKADGAITEQEQRQLERRKKLLDSAGRHLGDGKVRTGKTAAEGSDAEKSRPKK